MSTQNNEREEVYSVAISGRVAINNHALNNEKTVGNQNMARTVNVFDKDLNERQVNAISGQMLKYIQNKHMLDLAKDFKKKEGEDLMCDGCYHEMSNKIKGDNKFMEENKSSDKSSAISEAIKACIGDDIGGIMVTSTTLNFSRKSAMNFGVSYNIPEVDTKESMMNVKYSDEEIEVKDEENMTEEQREKNEEEVANNNGQNIFHQETVSGQQVFNARFDSYKVSLNEIKQEYALEQDKREERYLLALKSLFYTLTNKEGAKTSTFLPDVLGVEGTISVAYDTSPAPMYSPLNDDYKEEIEKIAENKKALDERVETYHFSNQSELMDILVDLYQNTTPYRRV